MATPFAALFRDTGRRLVGGVGNSGMGKYHGEWGFRSYTNARGVLYHSTSTDLGIRYPPYPPNPAA